MTRGIANIEAVTRREGGVGGVGSERLGVVVEFDGVAHRVGLAGQDDARSDLLGLQGIVAVHPDLP